jgi:regulator of ribosome biosynthesis
MEVVEPKRPLPVTVNKPTPYTFDLGLLLATDPNPLVLTGSANLEDDLAATARDGVQALLNQLLSTCPVASTPNGVLLSLPAIETSLPREKVRFPSSPLNDPIPSILPLLLAFINKNPQPLPPPKAQTTWQKFAAKKGIKPKTAEEKKKMVYDEATGEWVPKWGYKGKNKEGEGDWIVEVDEKKERERKEGTERQGDGRRERKEKVKRNERMQRANDRKGRKNGAK